MFRKKTLHETWCMSRSTVVMKLPVAHSCGLLNHLNSFQGGMFKLSAKFDADSLLYSIKHFECDCHTVHMLTWQSLLPSLSTVKSSLFMHAHSGPLSWAARLRWCCADILVILTIAGLFLDRLGYGYGDIYQYLSIYISIHIYIWIPVI